MSGHSEILALAIASAAPAMNFSLKSRACPSVLASALTRSKISRVISNPQVGDHRKFAQVWPF